MTKEIQIAPCNRATWTASLPISAAILSQKEALNRGKKSDHDEAYNHFTRIRTKDWTNDNIGSSSTTGHRTRLPAKLRPSNVLLASHCRLLLLVATDSARGEVTSPRYPISSNEDGVRFEMNGSIEVIRRAVVKYKSERLGTATKQLDQRSKTLGIPVSFEKEQGVSLIRCSPRDSSCLDLPLSGTDFSRHPWCLHGVS